MTHDEFRSIKGDDGMWLCYCKTAGCGWVGEPQRHVFDCARESIRHTKATAEKGA